MRTVYKRYSMSLGDLAKATEFNPNLRLTRFCKLREIKRAESWLLFGETLYSMSSFEQAIFAQLVHLAETENENELSTKELTMAQQNEYENIFEKDTDPRVWVVIKHIDNPMLILVGKRGAECNNPGTYGLFGGHLDGDETPIIGARRELLEETGMGIHPLHAMRPHCTLVRKEADLHYFTLDSEVINSPPQVTAEVESYFWYDTRRGALNFDHKGKPIELHYSLRRYVKWLWSVEDCPALR